MPESDLPQVPVAALPLPPALDAEVVSATVAEGVDMRAYCDTSAKGRPLVLLHSINAAPSAMEVKPLFDHYRDSRPVYAPELPGFGQSTRGDLPYSPDFYADCLARFIAQLPGPAPDVLALSLTAEFAARAVCDFGAECHSLIFISPTGVSRRSPPDPGKLKPLRSALGRPWFGTSFYRALTSRLSIRFFLSKAFVGSTPGELVDYACQTTRVADAQWAPFAFLGMELFTQGALESLYESLTVPTLVLFDEDPNVDLDRLPLLLECNPQVVAERIMPSLGLPHWELPTATFSAIDAFLNGLGTD